MAIPNLQRDLDLYPNLQPEQQRLVREKVFEALTDILGNVQLVHQRGDAEMAIVDTLTAFVQTYVADFNADGTTSQATAARTAIRQEIADYANRQTGISGATVA